MRAKNREDGQSIVLVVLGMGIFLIGAVGLGFDGSHLYSERTRAQLAADAAAQAAMISIFNGTNTFSTSAFTCTTTGTQTPCVYARNDGFGGTAADTVTISYPADSAAPGISFSSTVSPHLVQATVSRSVPTTLMRLLGPTATTVQATAMAAIVDVITPTPIVVTHPSLASSLFLNGNTDTIKICGGPTKSIQVNSSNASAFSIGQGNVDLSQAGPGDPGDCSSVSAGADLGVTGGPSSVGSNLLLGTSGHYVPGAFAVDDPFGSVSSPTDPLTTGSATNIGVGVHGCAYASCTEYTPGDYASLDFTGKNIILDPGLYYVKGGGVTFKNMNGGQGAAASTPYNALCSGCAAVANTGTGVVIYDTHATGSTSTGGFDIETGANFALHGATPTTTNSLGETVPASPYYGILFFEDRTADAHTGNNPPSHGGAHNIGVGNGCFTLIGSIYITNTKATMTADSTHYQQVTYNGTPCSSTVQQGYIVVSVLQLKGTTTLKMTIPPYGYLTTHKIALVQ
jgi:hypothetical protein